MKIQTFIEKAIAGGWKGDAFPIWHVNNPHSMLLDPLAWQAVGKVEGWGAEIPSYMLGKPVWHTNMSRMIDALASGKTIEQYLETL